MHEELCRLSLPRARLSRNDAHLVTIQEPKIFRCSLGNGIHVWLRAHVICWVISLFVLFPVHIDPSVRIDCDQNVGDKCVNTIGIEPGLPKNIHRQYRATSQCEVHPE